MGNPQSHSRAIGLPTPKSSVVGHPPRRSMPTEHDEDAAPDPADAEHDRAWAEALAGWLGRLTAVRDRLLAPEYTGELPAAVARATDLVNAVAVFAGEHATGETSERSLNEFMGVVGEYLAAAEQVAPKATSLWGRLAGRTPPVPVADCGRLVRDLPGVIERGFLVVGGRFRQREPALAWMDTVAVFLTDLRRSTRWADRLCDA